MLFVELPPLICPLTRAFTASPLLSWMLPRRCTALLASEVSISSCLNLGLHCPDDEAECDQSWPLSFLCQKLPSFLGSYVFDVDPIGSDESVIRSSSGSVYVGFARFLWLWVESYAHPSPYLMFRKCHSWSVSYSEPSKVLLVGADHCDPSQSETLFHERSSPADECHLGELLLHWSGCDCRMSLAHLDHWPSLLLAFWSRYGWPARLSLLADSHGPHVDSLCILSLMMCASEEAADDDSPYWSHRFPCLRWVYGFLFCTPVMSLASFCASLGHGLIGRSNISSLWSDRIYPSSVLILSLRFPWLALAKPTGAKLKLKNHQKRHSNISKTKRCKDERSDLFGRVCSISSCIFGLDTYAWAHMNKNTWGDSAHPNQKCMCTPQSAEVVCHKLLLYILD